MKRYWYAFRQFDRNILLFLVYWGAMAFAYFGVESVLMNLYLLRLGYGPDFLGLLLGLGQFAWAAFALPAGAIGSRVGAKRAMTAGMLVIAAGTSLTLAAEALPLHLRPAGLVLAWMISWVGGSLAAVNGVPYLMSVTDHQTRDYAFSAQQAVMAAAGFAGSLASGILPRLFAGQMGLALDHPAPYRIALILAPLVYLIGALAFARAKTTGQVVQPTEAPEALKAPTGLFLFLGLLIGFQSFSEGVVRSFFNVYLDTVLAVPTDLIGGIMGSSQLGLVLIAILIPAVLTRWGPKGSLIITTLGSAVFIFVIAWVPTLTGAALGYLGMIGMVTMMTTARGIYSQEAVSPRWRTTSSAVTILGTALGGASAAWLGGSLIQSTGFQGLFLLGMLFALLSVGMLYAPVLDSAESKSKEAGCMADPAILSVTGEEREVCQ